jgi:integrase
MASLDYNPKTRKARFFFRHDRKQYNKTLTMESARQAERLKALIEETLQDLERGKLTIPEGADVAAFILSGGKVASKPNPVSHSFQAEEKPSTIAEIFDTYAETLTPGSKEANSIYTEALHGRHFKRVLGEGRRFDSFSVDVLQGYVNKRADEGVVRDTIHKELTTLRVVWGWAHKRKHIEAPLAWHMSDLTLPKGREKPPFQTWDQIARKIERGGLSEEQEAGLWECLWLDQAQTVECLAWVHDHASRPFLHPMVAFAAYTGARRGEMVRSERDDWDFNAGVVVIRQKKSDKSKSFTRRSVAIHPALAEVMRPWFDGHPGGTWAIADEDGSPIDPRISTGYFRRLMRGGKWSVLHGWHTFRHSLASNMASAGVDQRIINEVLGHHTEEMERRYRHLLPQKQAHALHGLFQDG